MVYFRVRPWLGLSVLFFVLQMRLITAQVVSPSAPPTIVEEHAAEIKLQSDKSPCAKACADIASLIPSQLFFGKDGDFAFWDAKQSDLTPACRVEPASAEEVSFILQTVVEAKCHFAIKSGGHARAAGFSNSEGGVTVDLVRMANVEVSSNKKSVNVGAGARWLDVYTALEEQGLSVVGGRVADVGVGGLTLGGGISFFSAEHGLACDSVISYDIVLPNATIKTITSSTHRDLYFALRGAGQSNFGIVTSFTYETITPSNPSGLWDSHKVYTWDKLSEVVPAWHKIYTDSILSDHAIGGVNVYLYYQPYDAWWINDRYIHTSHPTNETWPAIFAPFESIEGVPETTHVAVRPYSDITRELAAYGPDGDRTIYGTMTFSPSIELTTLLTTIFRDSVASVAQIDSILPCLVLQPLTARTISLMSKNGGNALGLDSTTGPLVILSTSWKWKHAADDAANYAAHSNFIARAEAAAKKMGLWHRFKYANYAEESQDVWGGYGEESLRRLKRVQSEVDPDGVFVRTGLAGGGFKLNEEVVVEKEKGWGRDEL